MGFGEDMEHGSLSREVILAIVVAVVLLGAAAPFQRSTSEGTSSSPPSIVVATPPVAVSGSSPRAAAPEVMVAPAFSPLKGVVALGPEPPSVPVTVEVGLATPDPAALAGLVSALYSPGTPEYRDFLTPSELAERFGPSASVVSAAQGYFERFGLSVRPSPDRLLLTVSGPSSRVGAAFGTTFETYRNVDGRSFFSHPTAATLPSVAPWSGVFGLGNVTPFVPAAGAATSRLTAVTPAASCAGSQFDLTPCQIWQAYNMTTLIAGGTNGSGFRLAVVDPYSAGESQSQLSIDLSLFAADSGFAVGTVNYLYPDLAPGDLNVSSNPDWSLEDALDLQWARAAAPGATIDMTFSPDAGPGLYAAVDWLVAHQAADVISLSWGEPDVGDYNTFLSPCSVACNASTDGSYGILVPVLAFAAAEGISVFAASGDCGAADGTSTASTNFPASVPDVTGVGGTLLGVSDNGTYLSEVAWNGNASGALSPGCQNQGGSGGGYSPFPRPAWQTGLPAGTAGRGVPDVALDASNPAFLIYGGNPRGVRGTSLATPIWAGIAADADQFVGGRLGLLNPSLYAIASSSSKYASDFHDIVQGNNGYSAGKGWDPVTGLGSPQVANLVVDLAHAGSVPPSTLATFVYATPRFGPAPLTVTFHVSVTGGTGTYPLEGVSFGDSNASFAPGGVTTYTYDIPGVYPAQAYVADSAANYSLSPPLAIVVGGGIALAVTLTASMAQPAVGASVLFSVGVTGGVAPYVYNYSFGDGTYFDRPSIPSTSHVFGAEGSFCAAVVVSDSASPENGGASARVAIGVGGAPVPDCRNDTPLTMVPAPGLGVRDAPADFPDIFSVSGGSTAAGTLAPSLQFLSTDPYIAACECAIFRAPGNFSVHGFANDSENEQATAATNVTVAPPLVATFTANRTIGPAPLTVGFHASSTGGYGANASLTAWTFGDGTGAVGASVSVTYSEAGLYVAIGHLSDLGHGNASEAYLIDVAPTDAAPFTPTMHLVASITPAVDVPQGTAVNFTSEAVLANGSVIPAAFHWGIGSGSGANRPSFDWTYSSPSSLAANGTLTVTVSATDLTIGGVVDATFELLGFAAAEPGGFLPRVNGLVLADHGAPASGVAPLVWDGSATVTGPGTTSVFWAFGSGSENHSATAQHSFEAGRYTVVVTAVDSWGDNATDLSSVEVLGGLELTASLSTTAGTPPLNVTFHSNASGGDGPPYQYRWSFGDGDVAGAENGTHTFGSSGTYLVTLNVTDPGNDSATMNWSVTVGSGGTGFDPVVLLAVGAFVGEAFALIAAASRRRSPDRTAIP